MAKVNPASNVVQFPPIATRAEPSLNARPRSSTPKPQALPSVVLQLPVHGPREEAGLIETAKKAHRGTTRHHSRPQVSNRPTGYAFNQVSHSLPEGFTEAKNLTIITVQRSSGTQDAALVLMASYETAQRSHAGLHRRSHGLEYTPH